MLITTAKEALAMLDELLDTRSLTQIQEFVFDRAWEGDSYATIAEKSGYDEDYIKAVGARLWKSISQLLGIRVIDILPTDESGGFLFMVHRELLAVFDYSSTVEVHLSPCFHP